MPLWQSSAQPWSRRMPIMPLDASVMAAVDTAAPVANPLGCYSIRWACVYTQPQAEIWAKTNLATRGLSRLVPHPHRPAARSCHPDQGRARRASRCSHATASSRSTTATRHGPRSAIPQASLTSFDAARFRHTRMRRLWRGYRASWLRPLPNHQKPASGHQATPWRPARGHSPATQPSSSQSSAKSRKSPSCCSGNCEPSRSPSAVSWRGNEATQPPTPQPDA